MPCKSRAGGECVPDQDMPSVCTKCGQKLQRSVVMGSHVKLPPVHGCLRVILLGHGTHHAADGQFLVPDNVTIYFKAAHGSTTMGGAMDVVCDPAYTVVAGAMCNNYRLWPMVGENNSFPRARSTPYHHAHRGENSYKFQAGNELWMFSARSQDGPRLSSIIDRVLLLTPGGVPIEIVWLPCREIVLDNSLVQTRMAFADHNPPTLQY